MAYSNYEPVPVAIESVESSNGVRSLFDVRHVVAAPTTTKSNFNI